MNHRRKRPRKQPCHVISSAHRVFEPRRDAAYEEEPVVILTDWRDELAREERNLNRDDTWYGFTDDDFADGLSVARI